MIYRTQAAPEPPAAAPAPAPAPPAATPAGSTGATRAHTYEESDASLARRTLRTVALLVVACVVFVGALSAVAVAVTSRAVGSSSAAARSPEGEAASAVKKPLSI